MRKQFVQTLTSLIQHDERAMVLLGDIGVFAFRDVFRSHPRQIFNVGICEQAMAGMAAGLAKEGFIPVLHSIAPFIVERCYEQLKVDFCYQRLPVKIISVGASYDYAALGCTHHCPEDVLVMAPLPGMEIVVPGTAKEFDRLLRDCWENGRPTYFRLSEKSNAASHDVAFGKAQLVKQGSKGTVVVVGNLLDTVSNAVEDLDVTLLYYTTVKPFDAQMLRQHFSGGYIVSIEPYYEGALLYEINCAMKGLSYRSECIGVPREFLTAYGHPGDHDRAMGLTMESIRARVRGVLGE